MVSLDPENTMSVSLMTSSGSTVSPVRNSPFVLSLYKVRCGGQGTEIVGYWLVQLEMRITENRIIVVEILFMI